MAQQAIEVLVQDHLLSHACRWVVERHLLRVAHQALRGAQDSKKTALRTDTASLWVCFLKQLELKLEAPLGTARECRGQACHRLAMKMPLDTPKPCGVPYRTRTWCAERSAPVSAVSCAVIRASGGLVRRRMAAETKK